MDKLTISRILVDNKYLLPVTKADTGVHVVDIPKAAGLLNDLFQQKLQQTHVGGSLPPYDGELLKRLWTERNPEHETNADTGENMFYRTVYSVLADYMQLAGGNDA
jgi:hypothetical protein